MTVIEQCEMHPNPRPETRDALRDFQNHLRAQGVDLAAEGIADDSGIVET